ncbi:MAG: DUF1883 domain-containing protein [Candidatus Omnitrophica bacterium]|nr:DUF1883 domain-containing protein [Candidatus Omnitrophota bacterium]MCF7917157.1 DUF1883 domain-containing protein [Candidatus Omnitrophota bacterium]
MNFLHKAFKLSSRNVVRVRLNKVANVFLLSDANFRKYKAGYSFEYYGGRAKRNIVNLSVPKTGRWHLVIDGFSGTLKYGYQII